MFGWAASAARYDSPQQRSASRQSSRPKNETSTWAMMLSATASRISSLVAKWL